MNRAGRSRPFRVPAIQAAWLIGCVVAAFLLGGAGDPAAKEAASIGLAVERARSAVEDRHVVVSTAWMPVDDSASGRWVILLDDRGSAGLDDAIVVEVSGEGDVLQRRFVRSGTTEFSRSTPDIEDQESDPDVGRRGRRDILRRSQRQ